MMNAEATVENRPACDTNQHIPTPDQCAGRTNVNVVFRSSSYFFMNSL